MIKEKLFFAKKFFKKDIYTIKDIIVLYSSIFIFTFFIWIFFAFIRQYISVDLREFLFIPLLIIFSLCSLYIMLFKLQDKLFRILLYGFLLFLYLFIFIVVYTLKFNSFSYEPDNYDPYLDFEVVEKNK